ncbi:hypothetical protein, partial [Thermogutta sp.]|uniref:hypothetical protein n=1 Tax=Thermogutta sp. TaxID=1962930 RepID=UPI0032203FC8
MNHRPGPGFVAIGKSNGGQSWKNTTADRHGKTQRQTRNMFELEKEEEEEEEEKKKKREKKETDAGQQ